jgi:hypothetical protein
MKNIKKLFTVNALNIHGHYTYPVLFHQGLAHCGVLGTSSVVRSLSEMETC